MWDINLTGLSKTQQLIMEVVEAWANQEKTPIARQHIFVKMKGSGVTDPTIKDAVNGLIKKGFIRKAIITSNKTYYVQLKRVSL